MHYPSDDAIGYSGAGVNSDACVCEDFDPNQPSQYRIPQYYGSTMIVLQVRDPLWMHAYWEITSDTADDLRRTLGDELDHSVLTLRVHDVTGVDFDGTNALASYDLQVHPYADNWYVTPCQPDTCYCVDLGLVTSSRKFYMIARSNHVHTPRLEPSDVVDEEWLTILELQAKGRVGVGGPYSPSMPYVWNQERRMREVAHGSGGVGAVSSPMMGLAAEAAPARGRSFWLETDAELIVRGATEPGSRVEIMGTCTPLSEDGTFTARMALPFGAREIQITATSADGIMQRHACWTVARTHMPQGDVE